MRTKTGSLPIGFRRGWSDWQKELDQVIAWAKTNGFDGIDVGPLPAAEIAKVTAAGLRVGTIDLPQPWGDLASPDAGKRKAMAEKTAEYIGTVAKHCTNFFTVIIPEKHDASRHDNFKHAVDGYAQLCNAILKHGARIAIEGWPGGHPHLSSLACTPGEYRAFLKEMPTAAAGINFDPSHLVRMGVDPVRFLGEFASRVHHVHGKDTEIFAEELYEHGWEQPSMAAKGHGFGGSFWRYTIPGHGQVRWTRCFEILKQAGFDGMVSIELEDERYNTDAAGEKAGLSAGRDYLASV
ncbi:MAG: sugar phosphate isomerase/epimerase [Planctomycetes bacterium]|nr:sugar phosphate isomerase/epimerase [Planctomycetota bacterium]